MTSTRNGTTLMPMFDVASDIDEEASIDKVEIIIRAEGHNSVWVAILFVLCMASTAFAVWSLSHSRRGELRSPSSLSGNSTSFRRTQRRAK